MSVAQYFGVAGAGISCGGGCTGFVEGDVQADPVAEQVYGEIKALRDVLANKADGAKLRELSFLDFKQKVVSQYK